MRVEFTPGFIDVYVKRFSTDYKFQKIFDKRIIMFGRNHHNLLLKDHKLLGKMEGFRAFSITRDVRVIYYIKNEIAYFVNIGSHNQVYS